MIRRRSPGNREQFARTLAVCSVALWLAGSVSAAEGGLAPQWTHPHCPQGQTQGAQHSHNHCFWYCGGIEIQGMGERGGIFGSGPSRRVWSLGAVRRQDAVVDAEVAPRGPPRTALQIASRICT